MATYPKRESKSLEFKEKIPKWQNLIKTSIAFANGSGGAIIIGIEDDTGAIVGTDDETRERVYEEFPNSLYDNTTPALLVDIYEQMIDNKTVVIIEIPKSNKKPVLLKSEGMPKGVYLRAGASTRRASKEHIEEMIRLNRRMTFDEEVVDASTDILDKNLLSEIYGMTSNQRLIEEKIISDYSVSENKHHPTVTGVVHFCHNPERYLPEAIIQCSRFAGTEGRQIIQTEEITGNINQQVETSVRLIASWLRRDYKIIGAKLIGKTLIPEEALREAIINAVIHRSYWIPGSIKIALYDDRLEIFSPGNFPGNVNIHRLNEGLTHLRNPHIARIARRFGLVEKLGTGIRLIMHSCKKTGLQTPAFTEGADSVKLTFYFTPAIDNTQSDQNILLRFINQRKVIKIADVMGYLNVSRNTASRRLSKLVSEGKILRTGKGPNVQYTAVK